MRWPWRGWPNPLLSALLIGGLLVGCGGAPPARPTVAGASPRATPTATSQPAVEPVEFVWQTDGSPNKFERVTRLAADSQGALYVIDTLRHRVHKFDSGGQPLLTWGGEGSGPGQFFFRFVAGIGGGIAADDRGAVYVVDGHHRVQKFDANGALLLAWGSEGNREGQFLRPGGLAVDRQGAVYVADSDNHRVQKFDANGAFLTAWGRQGTGTGEFQRPLALAVDGQGHVYVSDQLQRIQKFDANGAYLTGWGVRGVRPAEFTGSISLAVDAQGVVYAADGSNHRVQVFDQQGNFLAQWGSQGSEAGQFSFVGGIALDQSGNIYVADVVNARVQKFRLRQPWPTTPRGTPTPRPPTPTPAPTPTLAPPSRPFLTPTER